MLHSAKRLLALLVTIGTLSPAASFRHGALQKTETAVSDQSFWSAQWRSLEGELTGLLQVSSESKNVTQNVTLPVAKNPAAPPTALRASKSAKKGGAADGLGKIQGMMKGLMGKAMLAPMLDMMKGMYQDQKKRIGDLNKREVKSKKTFEEQQARFDKQMQETKEKFDHHRLPEDFYKNETRDMKRQFKYWEGVRSRNKRQYHNNLKITHGMMAREKDMITQYESAMNTPDTAKKSSAAPVGKKEPEQAPEVVLAQARAETAEFCKTVLVEVRTELQRVPVSNVMGLYTDAVL